MVRAGTGKGQEGLAQYLGLQLLVHRRGNHDSQGYDQALVGIK